jgi:hypothetical protein
MSKNPGDLKKTLDNLLAEAKTLDDNCMKAVKSNYKDLKRQVCDMQGKVNTAEWDYTEVVQALQFKLEDAGRCSRKEYQAVHWQKERIKSALVKGQHGDGQAKFAGSELNNYERKVVDAESVDFARILLYPDVEYNPASLDPAKLTYFYKQDGMVDKFESEAFWEEAAGYIVQKLTRMEANLIENPRWVGNNGVLDNPVYPSSFKLLAAGVSEMPGARITAIMMKTNCRRTGTIVIPFTGGPLLLYGSCDIRVWVHLLPIEQFLAIPAPPSCHHPVGNALQTNAPLLLYRYNIIQT